MKPTAADFVTTLEIVQAENEQLRSEGNAMRAYAELLEGSVMKVCPTIQAVLLRLPATGFENMKDDLREVLATLGVALSNPNPAGRLYPEASAPQGGPPQGEVITEASGVGRAGTLCENCGYDYGCHRKMDEACPVFNMDDWHPTLKWKPRERFETGDGPRLAATCRFHADLCAKGHWVPPAKQCDDCPTLRHQSCTKDVRGPLGWIDDALTDLCEIPDRNSPDDFPEALVVTCNEVREAIERHLPTRHQVGRNVPTEDQLRYMVELLRAAKCPFPGCVDGEIISTGPEPMREECEWCWRRRQTVEAFGSQSVACTKQEGGDA